MSAEECCMQGRARRRPPLHGLLPSIALSETVYKRSECGCAPLMGLSLAWVFESSIVISGAR
jgi:hypothetical protein